MNSRQTCDPTSSDQACQPPGSTRSWPACLDAARDGTLSRRAAEARARLSACDLCPRRCAADRNAGAPGVCLGRRDASVSTAFAHRGEEPCLSGTRGSGTIFFCGCALGCVFCQNSDLSHRDSGRFVDATSLAGLMLRLQEEGCHNLNFVTPGHVVAQLLEALVLAIPAGLRLPLVFNTSGYDSVQTLRLLNGVVDIYMPDFKFWDGAKAGRWAHAPDYPEVARAAVVEMHRQVGDLQLGDDGIARRGLLVRHLVMPGDLDSTRNILRWLAEDVSPDTFVNVMDQYRPAGKVFTGEFPELAIRPARAELRAAHEEAARANLRQSESSR